MTTVTTASNNTTLGCPCRCGETHTGEYALEQYRHHECLHGQWVHVGQGQIICEACGACQMIRELDR